MKTDEARQRGTPMHGQGDRYPFVKWSDEPAFVEGVVTRVWEMNMGEDDIRQVVTLEVQDASRGLECILDRNTPPLETREQEMVNVGTNYASLRGAVTDEHDGRTVHFAFTGWQKTQKGVRFRGFELYDITPDGGRMEQDADDLQSYPGNKMQVDDNPADNEELDPLPF